MASELCTELDRIVDAIEASKWLHMVQGGIIGAVLALVVIYFIYLAKTRTNTGRERFSVYKTENNQGGEVYKEGRDSNRSNMTARYTKIL